jgi:hypothetical protein
MDDGVEDPEARVISAQVGDTVFVNAYVVKRSRPWAPTANHYKLGLDAARLRDSSRAARKTSSASVVCGDFNVTFDDRDVHDPVLWHEKILCQHARAPGAVGLDGVGPEGRVPQVPRGRRPLTRGGTSARAAGQRKAGLRIRPRARVAAGLRDARVVHDRPRGARWASGRATTRRSWRRSRTPAMRRTTTRAPSRGSSPASWGRARAPSTRGAGSDGPDVLLVTLDTTRADHLGCYGYQQHDEPQHRPARRGRPAHSTARGRTCRSRCRRTRAC